MSKEPWPGYSEWDREARKIQREMRENTAAFGAFGFWFSCMIAVSWVIGIWCMAISEGLSFGWFITAIGVTTAIWFGLRAAAYGFDAIHADDNRSSGSHVMLVASIIAFVAALYFLFWCIETFA